RPSWCGLFRLKMCCEPSNQRSPSGVLMTINNKKKILVVEDDPSSLEFLRSLLSHSGYQVITAENGEQALDKAKADPPDLVVSDILMPSMDGFELAQKIRLDPVLSQTRMIFYSATYHASQT